MSGVDIGAIRTALAAGVAAAIGDLNVYDYAPDGAVNMPAVVFDDDDPVMEVHGTMQGTNAAGGFTWVHLKAFVLVSNTITRGARQALDALCATGAGQDRSVIDAIETTAIPGASQVVVQEVHATTKFSFSDQGGTLVGRELSMYVVANRGA